MPTKNPTPFSPELQAKIDFLKSKRVPKKLGSLNFASSLFMAPMASITSPPWRLLMEDLGAGGTVSELISCHGINYQNEKTLKMLRVDPREQNVGIQLFGEEAEALTKAAEMAQNFGAKFIDLNMGCPVRKVVGKGAGAALMQTPEKLPTLFRSIKKNLSIPLSIKIRTGWDDLNLNAKEIIQIAKDEGIEFVAIHGRTRAQQYSGKANWEMIEDLAKNAPLPLIGNGDLNSAKILRERIKVTHCKGLMLGRGALKNPFLFLEAENNEENILFEASDYWEVIKRFYEYTSKYEERDKVITMQIKKHVVWLAAGYPGCAHFRGEIFSTPLLNDCLKRSEDYFLSLQGKPKHLSEEAFLVAGDG